MPFRQSRSTRCHSGKPIPPVGSHRMVTAPAKPSSMLPCVTELRDPAPSKRLPLTHRPALPAAILFIVGIVLHRLLPHQPPFYSSHPRVYSSLAFSHCIIPTSPRSASASP